MAVSDRSPSPTYTQMSQAVVPETIEFSKSAEDVAFVKPGKLI